MGLRVFQCPIYCDPVFRGSACRGPIQNVLYNSSYSLILLSKYPREKNPREGQLARQTIDEGCLG